ncbi:hypothetical protein JCM10212_005565 [Sporobolomyces blumeae]
MADLVRRYLLCCLPQPRPADSDSERRPLLDPDVLPQAPPRPPPTRTSEEQALEQARRRQILHEASERFINILSPSPFTAPSAPSSPPSLSSTSPSASISASANRRRGSHHGSGPGGGRGSPSLDSISSSPTLTSHYTPSPTRNRDSSRQGKGRKKRAGGGGGGGGTTDRERDRVSSGSGWRPPVDGPIAPVRVVYLGKNWEERSPGDGRVEADGPGARPGKTPTRKGKGNPAARPASSHSMRTLPRGGGGGTGGGSIVSNGPGGGFQPSPLRNRGPSVDDEREDFDDEREDDVDGGDEDESRFGTITSYRTAGEGSEEGDGVDDEGERGESGIYSTATARGGSSRVGQPRGLRDLWETSHDGKREDEGREADPSRNPALARALQELEASMDTWKLEPVGPIVADLADYKQPPSK